jgi:hypothetical protein
MPYRDQLALAVMLDDGVDGRGGADVIAGLRVSRPAGPT